MQALAARYWKHGLGLTLVLAALSLLSAVTVFRNAFAHGLPREPIAHAVQPAAAKIVASAFVAPQAYEPLTPEQAVADNAKLLASTAPNPPAKPFSMAGASALDKSRALTCLTLAVYYEAGNQGSDGEAAVAQVVLNRARNAHFPNTVCGVVFQGYELSTGCQFTFTCDGSLSRQPVPALWRAAAEVAERALGGYVQKSVGSATHYHTMWVVPYWRPSVVKVVQIGAHVFYRLDGSLGAPGAFTIRYLGAEPAPPARGLDADTTVAQADAAATPEVVVVIAAPPQPIAAPKVEKIEVAIATTPALLNTIPTHLEPPKPESFFGHPTDSQRLPMSSHW